jgi:hypothetical protein
MLQFKDLKAKIEKMKFQMAVFPVGVQAILQMFEADKKHSDENTGVP